MVIYNKDDECLVVPRNRENIASEDELFNEGYQKGYNKGYDEGYDVGIEACNNE